MKNPKTFYVRTYGCQMNELDSELMVGVLERRGLTRTEEESEADLLIYNTCSIRDLAERKVMGKLGILAKAPRKDTIIGVTGCMANAKKDSLFHKLSHIDFVLGTNNIHDLDPVLDEVLAGNQRIIRTDEQFSQELDYFAAKRDNKISAYVSIIRGCDKFCTYCVVPYTRGPEVSRHPDDIVKEVQKLVDTGYQEITLLGQNVNSYGKDQQEWGCLFHDLLYRLDKTGIKRIRFMTSHPVDITRELMEAIRDLKSMCEFVHFPLQAGSDRILKKMHRIYTLEQYLEKVNMLRQIVPNVVLGTDIIVGFPTETEEDFQQTYNIMKEVGYMTAFLYTFSPRKGTPAMRWKDDVPEDVKQDRLQRLMTLQDEITSRGMQKMLGQTVEMLVERRSSKEDRMLQGMTRCWRNVVIPGEDSLIGTMQQVEVIGYSKHTLIGKRKD